MAPEEIAQTFRPSRETPSPEPSMDSSLASLLRLEALTLSSGSTVDLVLLITNDVGRVVPVDRAALWVPARGWSSRLWHGRRGHVASISGVPLVERHTPFDHWLIRTAHEAGAQIPSNRPVQSITQVREEISSVTHPPTDEEHSTLCFLRAGVHLAGVLFLAHTKALTEYQQRQLAHLAPVFGHALWVQGLDPPRRSSWWLRWAPMWITALVVLMAVLIPIPLTVIAPATVSPRDPVVIRSPISGIVEEVLVRPGETVVPGQPLIRFDVEELRSALTIAERELDVARADLESLLRASAASLEGRSTTQMESLRVQQARLPQLQALVRARQVQRDVHAQALKRSDVVADSSGVVLLDDSHVWRGRPVELGQKMMEIVSPDQIRLTIELPPGDAITLALGGMVSFFSDAAPTDPVEGSLESFSYALRDNAVGQPIYRLTSIFSENGGALPRLGQRGVAKLYGPSVSFLYYVLRRPLAWFRRAVGF